MSPGAPPGLVGLLQALQQRVARLEAQAAGGEQLSPNYLTYLNGLVGANFTGVVNAKGLTLPSSDVATPSVVNQVQWVQQSNGAQVATITGYDDATGHGTNLSLTSQASSQTDLNNVNLQALDDLGNFQAGLSVEQEDRGLTSDVTALTQGGAYQVKILAAAGVSSFLQLASVANLAVAIGSATFVFAAANTAATAINHGLGRTPQLGLASCLVGAGNAAIAAYVTGYTPTQVGFGAYETSGVAITGNVTFYWLAIG